MFYFLPLISGHVLQSSANLSSSIQPMIYVIASAFILALVAAAALAPDPVAIPAPATPAIAGPFLLLAVFGLIAALIQSGGAVIQFDKVKALQQVGIFYVLFETAASLACLAALIERRWLVAAAAILLLAVDLLAGFRNLRHPRRRGSRSRIAGAAGTDPALSQDMTYGTGLVAVVLIMLLTHSARVVIFDRMAVPSTPTRHQQQ